MKEFIAIDFETATAERSSACAMAVVVVRESRIAEEHKFLIQPPDNQYARINSRVHGMTAVDTEGESSIDYYHQEIFQLLDGANVVAHNASFDMSVLKHSFEYYCLKPPCPNSISCTYRMTGMSLSNCCEQYGIELDHHDPLSDARACATLFLRLSGYGVKMPEASEAPRRSHTTINLRRDAITNDDVVDKETVFYKKNVVITGVFGDYERVEVADAVQALGASVKSSISSKTDILICGSDCGPAKFAKVLELKEQGIKDIEVIYEDYLHKVL